MAGALLEFDEGTYIVGFWCFAVGPQIHPPCGGDVMACVYKQKDDAAWTMMHRHRYIHPEQGREVRWGADNKDRLSARYYSIGGKSEEEIIKTTTDVMGLMAFMAGVIADDMFFEVKGNAERMSELVRGGRAPRWMHMLAVERTAAA